MKWRTPAICIMLILCAVSAVVVASLDDSPNQNIREDKTIGLRDYTIPGKSSSNIVNLSDLDIGALDTKYGFDATKIIDVLKPTSDNDVIIVEKEWLESEKNIENIDLDQLISDGHSILFLDDPCSFDSKKMKELGTAFFGNGTMYGMQYDPVNDVASYYTIAAEGDIDTSIGMMYNWATRTPGVSGEIMKVPYFKDAGRTYNIFGDRLNCGDFGSLFVRTTYTEILTAHLSESQFLIEYDMQINSNGGPNRATGMNVYNDVDRLSENALVDYSPTTSHTETAVSLSIHSANQWAILNWKYPIHNVSVIDKSNFGKNVLSISHWIDGDSHPAQYSYLAEPGAVVIGTKIDGVSHYLGSDEYSAEFRTKNWYGFGPISTFGFNCVVNI